MNFGFKTKTITAFLVVGFILLGSGLLNFWSLQHLSNQYSPLATSNMPKLKLINLNQGYVKESAISIMSLPAFTENKSKVDDLSGDFTSWVSRSNEIQKQYASLPMNEDEKKVVEVFVLKWNSYVEMSKKAFELAKNAKQPEDKTNLANFVNDDIDLVRIELGDALARIANFQNESGEILAAEAQKASKTMSYVSLFSVLVGFLISLALGIFYSGWISKTLTFITGALREGADQLQASTIILNTSSSELNSQISTQASSIQQTVAACEEITSTVRRTTEGTNVTLKRTQECSNFVDETRDMMEKMSQSIVQIEESFGQITKEVSQSYQGVQEIQGLITEIRNKTQAVNEIVFQTKLLSFNASVEAARAGEAGKGFAVVAEEVGNLAKMSGVAASEINEIIDQSTQRVETVFLAMRQNVGQQLDKGHARVGEGHEQVKTCFASLEKIKGSIVELSSVAKEIATGSEEQEIGISEINGAVAVVDQGLQKNSVSSESLKDLSIDFEGLAANLNRIVLNLEKTLTGQPLTSAEAESQTLEKNVHEMQNAS